MVKAIQFEAEKTTDGAFKCQQYSVRDAERGAIRILTLVACEHNADLMAYD